MAIKKCFFVQLTDLTSLKSQIELLETQYHMLNQTMAAVAVSIFEICKIWQNNTFYSQKYCLYSLRNHI